MGEQGQYGQDHSTTTRPGQTETMATLGRSLRSPSYFARAKRPSMTARTFSNSSEVSIASASSRSEDHFEFAMSAANTPAIEKTQSEAFAFTAQDAHNKNIRAEPDATAYTRAAPSRSIESSSSKSASSSNSRPIVIELPNFTKFNSAPGHTPPEPLSARGDVSGGYFPFHEDPKARVHRPHPFRSEDRKPRQPRPPTINLSLHQTSQPDYFDAQAPAPATMSNLTTQLHEMDSAGSDSTNTPVASFLPSGSRNTSLPMGKYYPSNYEQSHTSVEQSPVIQPSSPKQHQSIRSADPPNLTNSVQSDTQVFTRSSDRRNESDVKHRLQQYQRDMIAQARLAASEVLGGVNHTHVPNTTTVALNGVPFKLHKFVASDGHNPVPPRLIPLGSPGPVTPMDLECGETSYLDRGRPSRAAFSENDGIPRARYVEDRFGRPDSLRSPVIEARP